MTQVWAEVTNEFGMVKHELLSVSRLQTCIFLNCSKRMPITIALGLVVLKITQYLVAPIEKIFNGLKDFSVKGFSRVKHFSVVKKVSVKYFSVG